MKRPSTIVVGAGSVGCLVAMRLARDFGQHVLVCETATTPHVPEATDADRQRPARWLRLLGSADDGGFTTETCSNLAGRSLAWPRGRGLGGSSRINAMIWHDPTPGDLDAIELASGGAINSAALRKAVAEIESLVRPERPGWLSPTAQAFLAAMKTHPTLSREPIAGYRRFNRQGVRWTAESLLQNAPVGSIEIVHSSVDRVLFKGDRAIGVRIIRDGTAQDRFADHGVVLCAGTLATPMILVRSGIGPLETLNDLRLPHRYRCEAVGRNLQDHLVMPVVYDTNHSTPFSDQVSLRDLARWQIAGTGPLACNLAECGGLVALRRFQLHVTPTHYLKFPRTAAESAMTIAVNVTRPQSRGEVSCVSTDATAPMKIDTGYLSHPDDLDALVAGIAWVRELVSQSDVSRIIHRELIPGTNRDTRESLVKAIARYSQTLYHPVGTCAISADECGPVDPNFRVRGVDRLWIADGSILAEITQANPSVTLMSLGWIAASEIARVG